jgi:hypothetical protein
MRRGARQNNMPPLGQPRRSVGGLRRPAAGNEGVVKLGVLGNVFGLAGAIALTRVMVSLLFEVTPSDPATLIGVALLLAAVAMLACYIPARRALSIPMTALRLE